jgi:hypothetical protein
MTDETGWQFPGGMLIGSVGTALAAFASLAWWVVMEGMSHNFAAPRRPQAMDFFAYAGITLIFIASGLLAQTGARARTIPPSRWATAIRALGLFFYFLALAGIAAGILALLNVAVWS